MPYVHQDLNVCLCREETGLWSASVTLFDDTTSGEPVNFEFLGSCEPLFQELASVLDALIFTCMAIGEGRVSEGQLPLV